MVLRVAAILGFCVLIVASCPGQQDTPPHACLRWREGMFLISGDGERLIPNSEETETHCWDRFGDALLITEGGTLSRLTLDGTKTSLVSNRRSIRFPSVRDSDGAIVFAFTREETTKTEWRLGLVGTEGGDVHDLGLGYDPCFDLTGSGIYFETFTKDGAQIAHQELATGRREILANGYTVNLDPGGRSILFSTRSGLRSLVVGQEGAKPEPRALIDGTYYDRFANVRPGGGEIIFISHRDGTDFICTLDLDQEDAKPKVIGKGMLPQYRPSVDASDSIAVPSRIASAPVPLGVTGYSATWTGREAILFGGDGKDEKRGSKGAAYDPLLRRWRSLSEENAPDLRGWHTAVWTGDRMLIWGGAEEDTDMSSGFAYDPKQDVWHEIATPAFLRGRSCHVGLWTGDRFLVWGGVDEEHAFPNGGLYDPATDSWSAFRIDIGNPIPRNTATCWTGQEFLFFGGINGGHIVDAGRRWNLATKTDAPLTTGTMPKARCDHSFTWMKSTALLFGGAIGTHAVQERELAWIYDPADGEFRQLSARKGPSPRFGHGACWTGHAVVIAGGRSVKGGDTLKDVWAFDPSQGWQQLSDLPAGVSGCVALSCPGGVLLVGGEWDADQATGGAWVPLRDQ